MKTTRRKFVQNVIGVSAISAIGAPFLFEEAHAAKVSTTGISSDLQFSQIPLPYSTNALEPHIDSRTMDIHYNKHHAAYVKNVNDALANEKVSADSAKELFNRISSYSAKIRNNAGGAWNHNFFWQVMKPNGGEPKGKVLDAINGAFGSVDKFKEQFNQAALGVFGSGWAWLVKSGDELKIGSTPNQDNPLMDVSEFKGTPLLGIDVWEHAYYLKYQNKRAEYVSSWWNVVNWDEVAKNL